MTEPTYLAQFQGHSLTVIEHLGRPWVVGEEVGQALGLKDARTSINRIYARNQAEFGPEDSTEVRLTAVDGKLRLRRIYSQTGCILLAFFAQTRLAADFRRWAKVALAGQQAGVDALQGQLAAAREHAQCLTDALLAADPALARVRHYASLGLNNVEIGRLLGHGDHYVRLRRRRLAALGLLAPGTDLALAGGAR